MISIERACELIQESFDSLERSGTIPNKITADANTVLMGRGAILDSIGFVTFITELEDRMQQESGEEKFLVLTEKNEFNINNPNLTVDVLSKYIEKTSKK